METIDLKFKKPLTGKYNAGVYTCPECGEELLEDNKHGSVYKHIVGFADAYIGSVAMVECPECFCKWYFHSRINEGGGSVYFYFHHYMKAGECVHFK